VTGSGSSVTYTANPDAKGTDSFSFTVSDGTHTSVPATVSITISERLVAAPSTASVTAGAQTSITLGGSGAAKLSYTVVRQPTQGKLTGNGSALTYTANPDAKGTDSFSFTVSDGTRTSEPATVSITISERLVATAPSASITAGAQTSITLGGSGAAKLSYTVVRQPTQGKLTGSGSAVTYTANPDAKGADSFSFTVSDGTRTSEPATVSITISERLVATAPSASVTAGAQTSIALGGSGAAKLSYTVVRQPTQGKLTGNGSALTYTANPDAKGTDSFSFTVSDGTRTSEPATVSITISERLVAALSTASVTAGAQTSITLDGSGAAKLSYTVVRQPTQGKLTGSGSALTYTANPDAKGTDSFSFTVSDGIRTSEPAIVSISITEGPKQTERPATEDPQDLERELECLAVKFNLIKASEATTAAGKMQKPLDYRPDLREVTSLQSRVDYLAKRLQAFGRTSKFDLKALKRKIGLSGD
jgi:methionine-rich copper-binding protein CopC